MYCCTNGLLKLTYLYVSLRAKNLIIHKNKFILVIHICIYKYYIHYTQRGARAEADGRDKVLIFEVTADTC